MSRATGDKDVIDDIASVGAVCCAGFLVFRLLTVSPERDRALSETITACVLGLVLASKLAAHSADLETFLIAIITSIALLTLGRRALINHGDVASREAGELTTNASPIP